MLKTRHRCIYEPPLYASLSLSHSHSTFEHNPQLARIGEAPFAGNSSCIGGCRLSFVNFSMENACAIPKPSLEPRFRDQFLRKFEPTAFDSLTILLNERIVPFQLPSREDAMFHHRFQPVSLPRDRKIASLSLPISF